MLGVDRAPEVKTLRRKLARLASFRRAAQFGDALARRRVDTARNAEAVDALEEMGHEVTPVFISVDPSRDTPGILKEWTDYIHPRMIGLTGTPEEIAAVAREYRTYYMVPENPADDLYTVDHMTQTYLMLPQYGFVDFFTREATPEEIAERTACFIDAARK